MTFGHHPDPAVDFCVEVDIIEGMEADVRAGMEWRDALESRVFRAMQFNVGGVEKVVAAKARLRAVESRMKP